jgi:hypothetical protein
VRRSYFATNYLRALERTNVAKAGEAAALAAGGSASGPSRSLRPLSATPSHMGVGRDGAGPIVSPDGNMSPRANPVNRVVTPKLRSRKNRRSAGGTEVPELSLSPAAESAAPSSSGGGSRGDAVAAQSQPQPQPQPQPHGGGHSDPNDKARRTTVPFADINLRNFFDFLLVPSLVYEPRFPRVKAIRWRYIGQKAAEVTHARARAAAVAVLSYDALSLCACW